MAATRKTSSTVALATLVLTLISLLHLTTLSEACGGRKFFQCPKTTPTPSSSALSGGGGKCPVDTVKMGVCASLLDGLMNLELGSRSGSRASSEKPCCELVGGLADLDAAVCLCTALRADVLGVVDLSVPVQLGLLVNSCGKKLPAGFQCPNN